MDNKQRLQEVVQEVFSGILDVLNNSISIVDGVLEATDKKSSTWYKCQVNILWFIDESPGLHISRLSLFMDCRCTNLTGGDHTTLKSESP